MQTKNFIDMDLVMKELHPDTNLKLNGVESENFEELVPSIESALAPPRVRMICETCRRVECPCGQEVEINVRR